MATTSINISFSSTSSTVFSTPAQQTTYLDATNIKFLRQLFLTNSGIKMVKGSSVVQIPMSQLFLAAGTADPTMTWPPIISVNPVSQSVVHPLPVTFNVTASGENQSLLTYQWQLQASGSASFVNLPLANQSNWTGSATPTLLVSQSYYPNTSSLNGYAFRCVVSNPSGQTTSSAGLLTVS